MLDIQENTDLQVKHLIFNKFFARPGDFWVPNGAQANFIKMVGGVDDYEIHDTTWVESDSKDNFINLFVGANGSGKTDVICHIGGTFLGVVNNGFFKNSSGELYPFFRYPPAGGRGRIVSNSTAIRDTIVPKLLEILPEGSYTKDKKGRDYYCEFTGPNGRKFDLMTYEQEVKEFRSMSLGWCIFDEPEENDKIFLETTARFRRGGKIMFTLTPLGESAWVHNLVLGHSRWKVGAVYADVEVNCIKHGLRGMLQHSDIERMIAGWPEEERAARVHAQWMHLRGLVYPMFDRKVHVIDPREIPEEGTLYCAMDPHTARPPFIGWFKACSNGRLYMIKEWPEVVMRKIGKGGCEGSYHCYYDEMKHDDRGYDEYAEVIKQVEEQIGQATQRVMDGRFGNTKYSGSTRTVYQEYCARGVEFRLSENDPYLRRGHNRVRSLLRHKNALGEEKGKEVILPRLYISSECVNTIRGLEQYIFDPKGSSDSEAVCETGKDQCDVIRYMSDINWRYIDPQTMRSWRSMMIPKNKGMPAEGVR
jgi:hypothetical protein